MNMNTNSTRSSSCNSTSTSTSEIFNPEHGENDVFLARGHGVEQYPGVLLYRHLIEKHSLEYKKKETSATGKRDIANSIVENIHSNGGKFFYMPKRGNVGIGCWTEVPRVLLMTKIRQALRDHREVDMGPRTGSRRRVFQYDRNKMNSLSGSKIPSISTSNSTPNSTPSSTFTSNSTSNSTFTSNNTCTSTSADTSTQHKQLNMTVGDYISVEEWNPYF
jgi:hypothetical protein